jgi:hypothetical protein
VGARGRARARERHREVVAEEDVDAKWDDVAFNGRLLCDRI